MKYIADLHIHSLFSRATSKQSTLSGLFAWARVKGINIVGTGDFTHPGWFRHLKENLIPAEPGLFQLKDKHVAPALPGISTPPIPVRFVLTAGISNIYKRHGKVRKVHNLLFAPNFKTVERLNAKLAAIGNIEADGRPILGLDSRNLLEILLEQTTDGFLVPAHIWTPWFSLFGSKSGFDTIEECYGDLSSHIFALETGLSSDPDMNRLVSALDHCALISNSDCHSPSKLGREANIFNTDFSFAAMRKALSNQQDGGFLGTVEFFPEEGKYHLDGHRKCQVCLEPRETRGVSGLCPVCRRPLTIGVAHRVMELADRDTPLYPDHNRNFRSLVPLPELLAELLQVGPTSKAVTAEYVKVIGLFGSEFTLLLDTPIAEISSCYSPLLAEAVSRMRDGKVIKNPGYDGEFGTIKVFEDGELKRLAGQLQLFGTAVKNKKKSVNPVSDTPLVGNTAASSAMPASPKNRNPEQEVAINLEASAILVTAGPGTGKTYTLVTRIVRLIRAGITPASQCFAITFTNRAANEVQTRLRLELGDAADALFVGTFHRFCLDWLTTMENYPAIIGQEDRALLFKQIFPDLPGSAYQETAVAITSYLEQLAAVPSPPEPGERTRLYLDELRRRNVLDIDAIIPYFVRKLHDDLTFRDLVSKRVGYLFVDEFQDINRAQYLLVTLLGRQAAVFAIGDPDQAIYGFRGSDFRLFDEFRNLPHTATVQLLRNYRSATAILQSATAVIRHNQRPGRQKIIPQNNADGLLEYLPAPTPAAEAESIVRRIEELMAGISHFSINSGRGGETEEGGISFRDIAILTRLSRQTPEIAKALDRRGIPCQQVGSTPFFMANHLSPLYYFIKAASGMASVGEYLELLKTCPGIGAHTIEILATTVQPGYTDFFIAIDGLKLATGQATQLAKLHEKLRVFKQSCIINNISSSINEAISYLDLTIPESETKRFFALSGIFGNDLAAFANHLEHNSANTIYDPRAEAVALMTLHSAKGLEFPLIFIAGVEEGILPYSHHDGRDDIEEERRLFYVGMTRASRFLIVSSSATRTLHGISRRMQPSRFIREIPPGLLKTVEHKLPGHKKTTANQLKLF